MSCVIKSSLILNAINSLRSQKTHPLFAGYLHLIQRSRELKTISNLEPDFQSFFRSNFFVEGHPIGTPYLKVFIESTANNKNLWLNMNIAGSYAPSSLRAGQPFRRVVDIKGKEYSLFSDHAEKAFEYLLYGERINVVHLAIFLYRDFSFEIEQLLPTDLIDIFAYEYGYSETFGGSKSTEFYTLYFEDHHSQDFSDWIEVI